MFDPNDLAVEIARGALRSPQALSPLAVKELIVPLLLPVGLFEGVARVVDGYTSGGPIAALCLLDVEVSKAGKTFELDLLRIAIRAQDHNTEVTDAGLAALDRTLADWYVGAKEMIARGHPVGARDLLLRIVPIAPSVFRSRGQDADRSLAALLSLLALSLQELSRYDNAVTVYHLALDILDPDRADHCSERATILSNLGCLHHEHGNFELSSKVLDTAIDLLKPLLPESAAGLVAALANRGQSESYHGRTDTAEACWIEADKIAQRYQIASDPEALRASILLISHLMDSQRFEDGIVALRRAWRAACNVDNGALKAELIGLAGQGALRADHDARAIRLFSMAVERFRALSPDYAEDRIDSTRALARAISMAGLAHDALDVAQRALEDGETSLGATHIENAKTRRIISSILWDLGRYDEGEQCLRVAIDQMADFLPADHPTRLASDGEMADFLMVRGATHDAIDLLASCLERESALLERLVDERADVAHASAMRTAGSHLELIMIAALRTVNLDQTRLRTILDLRLRFGGSVAAIMSGARRGRRPPTTLLHELVCPDTVIAASSLFTLDGVVRRAILFADAHRARLIDFGCCGALDGDFDSWARDPVTTIGDALLHFTKCLGAQFDGHARLIWFPDENLARFPIAALPLDASRRVIDAVAVVQPRDAYCMLVAREPMQAPPLLVGVSTFEVGQGEETLEALPGVIDEIERVHSIHGPHCQVLTDGEAVTGAVLRALKQVPWVIHLATHGLFGIGASASIRGRALRRQLLQNAIEDPLALCALVLALDASGVRLITARTLAELDLSQTTLAVLAACDSGLGRADAAEGVLGFQAALHLAGVATVVTSLWPLFDDSTPQMMETLHRLILQGIRPSEALRRAQLEAAQSWCSPQAWGGLTVSGSDEPVVCKSF